MRFTVKERASGHPFRTPEEVFQSFSQLKDADQESFWVLGFNSKNREILRECLFKGGINSCLVDPKLIFKRILRKGCAAFITVHNHPSGDPAPSEDDLQTSRRIREAARVLDLQFLDDIIIGENGFVSFVRSSFLPGGRSK